MEHVQLLDNYADSRIYAKPSKEVRLLEQLKLQNRRALEKVIKRYTNYVGTILRNILREQATTEDIEELTADVFLSLWQHAPNLRTENLTGYLASIARSKAYNHVRRKKLPQQSIDDVVIVDNTDITAQAERNELSELLQDLLQMLSEQDREIFIRYYYCCQNVREIAGNLHLKEATVKTRMHRGREKLRQLLTERGYGYEEMELI